MVALAKSTSKTGSGVFFHPRTGSYATAHPGLKLVGANPRPDTENNRLKPASKKSTPFNPAATSTTTAATAASAERNANTALSNQSTRHRHKRHIPNATGLEMDSTFSDRANVIAPPVYDYAMRVMAELVPLPIRRQPPHIRDAWQSGQLFNLPELERVLRNRVIHIARQR